MTNTSQTASPSRETPPMTGFFGSRIASHLNMAGRAIAKYETGGALRLATTRLNCARDRRDRTAPVPVEDAFSMLHQLEPLDLHSCWLNGRRFYSGSFRANTVSCIDLRESPQCEFGGQFDALQFYVPALALAELADQHGAKRIDKLRWERDRPDTILSALSQSLLAASEQDLPNRMLVEQLSLGLLTHFGETYGGMRPLDDRRIGKLAAWQERRAKEILHARFGSAIGTEQVAAECRLTPSHFTRGFRNSFGVSPHRYLVKLRMEEAKKLLVRHDLTVQQIAVTCGFGSQAYMTRIFRQRTGITPGQWRRLVIHRG